MVWPSQGARGRGRRRAFRPATRRRRRRASEPAEPLPGVVQPGDRVFEPDHGKDALSASRAGSARHCRRPGSRGRRRGCACCTWSTYSLVPAAHCRRRRAAAILRRRRASLLVRHVQVQACRASATSSSTMSPVAAPCASGPPAAASGAGVQHHGAIGGAAHPCVADTLTMSGDALPQHLGRQRHVAGPRPCRGSLSGRSSFSTSTQVFIDIQRFRRRCRACMCFARPRTPPPGAVCFSSAGRRGGRLDHRAVQAHRLPLQHRDAGCRLERIASERVLMTSRFQFRARSCTLSHEGLAIRRSARRGADDGLELADAAQAGRRRSRSLPSGACRTAAGSSRQGSLRWPILHPSRASFQVHADAPGDGQQVDHRIGRAADRGIRPVSRSRTRRRASVSST